MDCGCPRGSMIKWMVLSNPTNLYHIIYKPWLTKYPPSRLSTGFFLIFFQILKEIDSVGLARGFFHAYFAVWP